MSGENAVQESCWLLGIPLSLPVYSKAVCSVADSDLSTVSSVQGLNVLLVSFPVALNMSPELSFYTFPGHTDPQMNVSKG